MNHSEVDLPKVMQLVSDRTRIQTQVPLFLSPSKKQTKLNCIKSVMALFVLTAFFFFYFNLYLDLQVTMYPN